MSLLRGCPLRLRKRGVHRPVPKVVKASPMSEEVARRDRVVCRRAYTPNIKARDSDFIAVRRHWGCSREGFHGSRSTVDGNFQIVSEVWLVTTWLICPPSPYIWLNGLASQAVWGANVLHFPMGEPRERKEDPWRQCNIKMLLAGGQGCLRLRRSCKTAT